MFRRMSLILEPLKYNDPELEQDFQVNSSVIAKNGIVATAGVFFLFCIPRFVMDVAFGNSSLAREVPTLVCSLMFIFLVKFSDKLTGRTIRMFGYGLLILVFITSGFSKVYNPILSVAFVTCALLLISIFIIRSFSINRFLLPSSILCEAVILFLRYHHYDSRPMEQKIAYYATVSLSWMLAPTLMAYYIEKESRTSFRLNQEMKSILDQERLIFSQLSTALILVKQGNIIWKNPACDKIFAQQGVKVKQHLGSNWVNNQANNELKQWMTKCWNNPETYAGDFPYFDGSIDPNHSKFLHISTSWIVWDGDRALIFVITDRTAEEDANKFKYKWLSTVSHEFRTPLNIVCNMIENLKEETEISEIGQRFLSLGDTSTRLLKVYVGDLLDYCLLRNDKFYISCQQFNILQICRQSIEMVQLKATDKEISLKFQEDVLDQFQDITNDDNRIQQVLINLLSNAIKFTKPGGTIALSVFKKEKDDNIVVQVEDNGIGIKEEDQGRLFTEYGRIVDDETILLNPQGVGLGLWICKRFCQEIGDGISISSKYNQGTTLTFSIKDYKANNTPQSTQESEDQSPVSEIRLKKRFPSIRPTHTPLHDPQIIRIQVPKTPRTITTTTTASNKKQEDFDQLLCPDGDIIPINFTTCMSDRPVVDTNQPILVVDDEPVNRFIVKHFCQKLNLEAIYARDGLEALEIIENRLLHGDQTPMTRRIKLPFRAILLDYQMPRMTGPELCQKLTQMESNGGVVFPPIIGYTAFISNTELEYFIECGAVDILEKPTTFDNFKAMIEKFSIDSSTL